MASDSHGVTPWAVPKRKAATAMASPRSRPGNWFECVCAKSVALYDHPLRAAAVIVIAALAVSAPFLL
ncbi:hypothetical protein Apmu_0188_16 [Acidiphilium multivorum AIU301]|nr:hypothetical protein Apmu_0188_16 [Acidiphilium multivorum AIU301]